MAKPNLVIYAGGGAKPSSNGPGGWAALVIRDDAIEEMSGYEAGTSNSRMNLMAVFMAIEALEDSSKIEFYTESPYVRRGITQWLAKWLKTGWRMTNNQPVQNQDLWEGLYEMMQTHDIRWRWGKIAPSNLYKKRVDELASAAREHRSAPPMIPLTANGQVKADTHIYVFSSFLGGSWGAVIVNKSGVQELQGNEANTTGNQAIMIACAKILKSLTVPQTIAIYTDNEYLVNGMSKWLHGWIKNDWRTTSGDPVKNQEQWKQLQAAALPYTIAWIYSIDFNNPYVERANNLAEINFD